ncbi:SCO2322 family protein [Streptomyces fractus]|uniref:SCO2322 family protein n=1 Tax=Streptomyces fractus TaxID=641806 RepID=UPI003CF56E54
MSPLRRVGATLAACTAAVLFAAAPAQAADSAAASRYWAYWTQSSSGDWDYATQGPATDVLADGSVIGFRFAASDDSGSPAPPRDDYDFSSLCSSISASDEQKRVGLVIDYGTSSDSANGATHPAERTACVQADSSASAADVLAQADSDLSYDSSGLLCAVDGYPDGGCDDKSSASSDGNDDGSSGGAGSIGIAAASFVILGLAVAGVVKARKRRN